MNAGAALDSRGDQASDAVRATHAATDRCNAEGMQP
jgi:hypothetical protein